MRMMFFGCCMLVLVTACGGGKKKADPFEALTRQIDSLGVVADTVKEEVPVAEETIPATADESFADFFYNFASDEHFQRSRIVFPLSYYKEKEVIRTPKDEWKYDPLFSRDVFYTVLFDREEDMEMEKDTSLNSVQVDRIYLQNRMVKRYYFQRVSDRWFLEAINKEALAHTEGEQEDFFDFYAHFAGDSLFQSKRLHQPLGFVTADPDDEFQILETTLDEGQWFSFRPPMRKDYLTNVRYGQKEVSGTHTKIVEFKGFGNGFSNTLYFACEGGLWKLERFEDLSD